MRRAVGPAMLLLAVVLSGCALQRVDKPPSPVETAAPRSILVLPVANRSLDVDAPTFLLTTLTVPLAEKGYYVFPVHTVRTVLAQEGFFEAEQVHARPPEELARLFGADAVLFVTINRWDTQYWLIGATTTVEVLYQLHGKDGASLWRSRQTVKYHPEKATGGDTMVRLVESAIKAAVTRAAPDYPPLARQANAQAFVQGPDVLPDGPYRAKKP